VLLSIGADAHSIAGLRHVPFGVGMARKGWLTKRDILNARPVDEFLKHAARRRARK
jgi:DNA polymerase (family 10)